jgi:hypothetical protein
MTLQSNIISGLSKVIAQSTNNKLRDHYDSAFWRLVREQANQKLGSAIRKDGTLVWAKLPKLLGSNPKIEKTPDSDQKYFVQILHLAPSWAALFNTCSMATLGCGTNCLNESGHGQRHMMEDGVHHVHVARVIRTLIWFRFRDQFKAKMQREIESQRVKAYKMDAIPVIRPNGTSDLRFESLWPELFSHNPDFVFYDYTKDMGRNVSHIPNYSLCYSVSEKTTGIDIDTAFANGLNCVVVLRLKKKDSKPTLWQGRPMIDGDSHDLRFLDPKGVFIGLYAKAAAYNDQTGFVHDLILESA